MLSDDKNKAPKKRPLVIAFVIFFYCFISITLVLFNKYLLSEKFPFPLVVTLYQLIIAQCCIWIMYPLFPGLPDLSLNSETCWKVLPLVTIYVGMLIFNNMCLLNVKIYMYQVVRSLSVCFSILFTYLILKQKTPQSAILATLVVVAGYMIGVSGKLEWDFFGFAFGILSSIFVSLNSIWIKKTLPHVQWNHWELLKYNNPLATILLLIVCLCSGELFYAVQQPEIFQFEFMFKMTLAALIGFAINIAIFLNINYTSPLTKEVTATSKACIQSLLGTYIFDDKTSFQGVLGCIVCIVGSAIYSAVQYNIRFSKQAESKPK